MRNLVITLSAELRAGDRIGDITRMAMNTVTYQYLPVITGNNA
jgi:hypothetical protein